MSENIHRSHSVSNLIYHIVFPTKYRRVVIDEEVDSVIVKICKGIQERYEIVFLEIGSDKDHIHFLVQSIPSMSPTDIVRIIKSITAKKIFKKCPKVKKQLWGGSFWSSGFYISTVSAHGNEKVISNYVKNQGDEYKKMYRSDSIDGQLDFGDIL